MYPGVGCGGRLAKVAPEVTRARWAEAWSAMKMDVQPGMGSVKTGP